MWKMARYEMFENAVAFSAWQGSTWKALGEGSLFSGVPNTLGSFLVASGSLVERSLGRLRTKPDWNLGLLPLDDRQHVVSQSVVDASPFGDLIRFDLDPVRLRGSAALVVAPMSGHHATLLRGMVKSLLPHHAVHVTDWTDARHIPVEEGVFDVETQARLLCRWMSLLGPDAVVFAVCQPVPVVLVALAALRREGLPLPRAVVLLGGPVDPDVNPTGVTDFGRRVTMGALEHTVITRVPPRHRGVGRLVYPGVQQLMMFMGMNVTTHMRAFSDKIWRDAFGDGHEHDRHNRFYDEYLAVMDLPAEFYLSTVERVFKNREVARNVFLFEGEPVDITSIEGLRVMVVEGGQDDISAPGQCAAAFDLLPRVGALSRAHLVHPTAGHYGIFAGRAWREDILPEVLSFLKPL